MSHPFTLTIPLEINCPLHRGSVDPAALLAEPAIAHRHNQVIAIIWTPTSDQDRLAQINLQATILARVFKLITAAEVITGPATLLGPPNAEHSYTGLNPVLACLIQGASQ